MNVRPSTLPAKEIVPSTCWECAALCGSFLTIEDGKVTKIAPNPGASGLARRVLRQGHPRPARMDLSGAAAAHAAAPGRRARQRPVRSRLVGRCARRNGRRPRARARDAWPPRDRGRGERRVLLPRPRDGAADARDRHAELADQSGSLRRLPRRDREDDRPQHRGRRRPRQRRLRDDRRAQSAGRRSAAVDGAQAGEGARRARPRHRSVPDLGGRDGGPLAAAPAGHRRRDRAGDDQGADRRRPLRPRRRGELVSRLRGA